MELSFPEVQNILALVMIRAYFLYIYIFLLLAETICPVNRDQEKSRSGSSASRVNPALHCMGKGLIYAF